MTDITQKIISFSPDVGTVLLALIKPIWAITAAMMARSIFHGIPTWSSYSKATVGLQSQLQVMVCGHALFGAVQAANWRPEEQNCDRKKSEGFAISEWSFTALTAIRAFRRGKPCFMTLTFESALFISGSAAFIGSAVNQHFTVIAFTTFWWEGETVIS